MYKRNFLVIKLYKKICKFLLFTEERGCAI